MESLHHLSHRSTGTKSRAQQQTTPRDESKAALPLALHASVSVAEGCTGYRLACSANKAEAKLLYFRRSGANAALRCHNSLPGLILWLDPLQNHHCLILSMQKSPESSVFNSAVCSAYSKCAVQTLMALLFSLEWPQSAIDEIEIDQSHSQ